MELNLTKTCLLSIITFRNNSPGCYTNHFTTVPILHNTRVVVLCCVSVPAFPPIPLGPLWRHQMETFSALLVLCEGTSPVTGDFTSQRPVTRSFGVFFDRHLNKRLSKESWGWWFETHRAQFDATVMVSSSVVTEMSFRWNFHHWLHRKLSKVGEIFVKMTTSPFQWVLLQPWNGLLPN